MEKLNVVVSETEKIDLNSLNNKLLAETLKKRNGMKFNKKIIIPVFVIFAGILTGYVLSSTTFRKEGEGTGISVGKKVVGSTDIKTFRDSAEGKLEKGGIDGEGTHKLIRTGGESQTVYLMSSVLDLEEFVGKKVKVWGETHSAKKAGWLMDVGRVELME